ncbi:MAG TPA: hypothetical protein VJ692_16575 [Nitrospiraceae bacterium]|nr:hypothetical protein [Nitrospiraceae bacterium]
MPLLLFLVLGMTVLTATTTGAAEITCSFKAQGETVELRIVADQQELWSGRLHKDERQTIRVPQGDFTVESRVYNPNLKTKETIVAHVHTKSCQSDRPMAVPLFPE